MGAQVTARPECRVVEIGNVLRAARERQGIELGEVERETRIRGRYLAALEAEKFELLPARAYAKGFLRVYADFLGLDGRLIVAEFDARFPDVEQPEHAPAQLGANLASAWTRRPSVLLVAGLAVAALLGVLAWRFESGGHKPAAPASPPTSTRQSRSVAAPPAPPPSGHPVARPAHLVLRARGRCWLSIRAESAAGPVLYEATLAAGGILRYTLTPSRPRLWLRIGAPWNLELSLNGKPATALPQGPGNVVVSRSGLSSA